MTVLIQEKISLQEYTTIGTGGAARFFARCRSLEDILEALSFAREKSLPFFILGGGSNVLFFDEGFAGVVLRIELKGIEYHSTAGQFERAGHTDSSGSLTVRAAAGESWDDFVRTLVERNLAGVECLSGIPGCVGAVPVQNVGAYGQEVSKTIERVRALELPSLTEMSLSAARCEFGYRRSKFKNADRDRYLILSVDFRLLEDGEPGLLYPELNEALAGDSDWKEAASNRERLRLIRSQVLRIRRAKSMLVDPEDPNSRSCGSFFLNPLLSETELSNLRERLATRGIGEPPVFRHEANFKVSAAWLVEQAGFPRGTERRGAAISDRHALALVNRGGGSEAVLSLAREVRQEVVEKFGILLEVEPVLVGPEGRRSL